MTGVRDRIIDAVADMPVVDHHEHAWRSFSATRGQEFDLPYFIYEGYLKGDLMAAGLPPSDDLFDYLVDPQLPDGAEDAWKAIRPFLDKVRSTSYFRYLMRGLWELFGVTEREVLSEQWRDASARIRAYSRQNRGQAAALCARMKVAAIVLDAKLPAEELADVQSNGHRILHVARLDNFIHEQRGLAATLEEHRTADLGQWVAAFDLEFRRYLDAGVAGFKSGLAYNRRIEYTAPSVDEAARIFRAGLLEATPGEVTAYQDFMVNHLCCLCVQADVPLQIHTGIQAGIGHVLEDTRPTLLTELFRRHPDLRVDVFHGGYPWIVHAGLMAKYFPNVTIDGCWLHHISPSAYREALTSWIEVVPMNKIFAWGGDHTIFEHSYASLSLAKELVADVLADLVNRDYFDVDLALVVARRILHDNGAEFWRIPAG